MLGFSVTYEIITHESAEEGDAQERGFVIENVSLREALGHVQGVMTASMHPFDASYAHVWFSTVDPDIDYRTGEYEYRSLHLPVNLTPSTRQRIARLIGSL